MKAMNRVWCLCAVSALSGSAAFAVPQSVLTWEASADSGATWHSGVDVSPGATVSFRLSVSLINNTGAGRLPSGGLLGFNTLPMLSNWSGTDVVQPFAAELSYEGSSANPVQRPFPGPYPLPNGTFHGSGVVNGGNGRQAPFGVNGANGNGVPVAQVVGGELQLVAGVIDNRGVSFSQLPSGLSTVYAWDGHTHASTDSGELAVDPPSGEIQAGLWYEYDQLAGTFFRPGVASVTVFQYTVTLSSNDASDRLLIQSSSIPVQVLYGPPAGVVPTGQTSASNNSVVSASVHVVPAPMGAAALTFAALGFTRRRRDR